MTVKSLSLVKYAGEYWFTLADYTLTRSTEGYSDSASVKSAVRTFTVKTDGTKYIAFRGEAQLKNIIQENKDNPLFQAEDFQGTRSAIISWSMLDALNKRFKENKEYKKEFAKFMDAASEYILQQQVTVNHTPDTEVNIVENRSSLLRQLRNELNRLDRDIEVRQTNREKILQAINAVEGLTLESI